MEHRWGRFWLAGQPDTTVAGWLDLSGRWPVVQLAEPLTAHMVETDAVEFPDGSVTSAFVPVEDGPEQPRLHVHGQLRGSGSAFVTLLGAFSTHRQWVMGPVVPDLGAQTLQADYALFGGLEPVEPGVTAARLRLRHLDSWAGCPVCRRPSPRTGAGSRCPGTAPRSRRWR